MKHISDYQQGSLISFLVRMQVLRLIPGEKSLLTARFAFQEEVIAFSLPHFEGLGVAYENNGSYTPTNSGVPNPGLQLVWNQAAQAARKYDAQLHLHKRRVWRWHLCLPLTQNYPLSSCQSTKPERLGTAELIDTFKRATDTLEQG